MTMIMKDTVIVTSQVEPHDQEENSIAIYFSGSNGFYLGIQQEKSAYMSQCSKNVYNGKQSNNSQVSFVFFWIITGL